MSYLSSLIKVEVVTEILLICISDCSVVTEGVPFTGDIGMKRLGRFSSQVPFGITLSKFGFFVVKCIINNQ